MFRPISHQLHLSLEHDLRRNSPRHKNAFALRNERKRQRETIEVENGIRRSCSCTAVQYLRVEVHLHRLELEGHVFEGVLRCGDA